MSDPVTLKTIGTGIGNTLNSVAEYPIENVIEFVVTTGIPIAFFLIIAVCALGWAIEGTRWVKRKLQQRKAQ